jgi:hypothetical protein
VIEAEVGVGAVAVRLDAGQQRAQISPAGKSAKKVWLEKAGKIAVLICEKK